MKNIKGFTTFFALIMVAMPTVSFADGTFYYGAGGFNEAPPVRTTGVIINQNTAPIYDINPVGNNSSTNTSESGNILGIKIKTQAERDAEKAAKQAAEEKAAENARVAKNSDGSFAYGYSNGQGASYVSGARYVDARSVNNSRYTASAGSSVSGGFLPTTLGGWILAIILIILLVSIIRAFNQKFNQRPVHIHAN
jgi:hypothetical protein